MESIGLLKSENLALASTVGYARNLALEAKEFRDSSFSWSGRRTPKSDKLTDYSADF
jgi:hypothetical protein